MPLVKPWPEAQPMSAHSARAKPRSETKIETSRKTLLLMPGPQNLWFWLHRAIILRLLFPCLSRDGCRVLEKY